MTPSGEGREFKISNFRNFEAPAASPPPACRIRPPSPAVAAAAYRRPRAAVAELNYGLIQK